MPGARPRNGVSNARIPWMCGNMKLGVWEASGLPIGVGWEAEVVELRVVLDGKFGLSGFCREDDIGIGCSDAMSR